MHVMFESAIDGRAPEEVVYRPAGYAPDKTLPRWFS